MAEEKKETKRVRQSSAQKRIIQSEKRRIQNRERRAEINTAVKKFKALAEAADQKPAAKEHLSTVFSLLDKAVKTKLFKGNKAGRMKSRLATKV